MTQNGEVKATLTTNIYTNKQDRCKACASVPASLSVSDKQNYPPSFSGKYSVHFFSALERYLHLIKEIRPEQLLQTGCSSDTHRLLISMHVLHAAVRTQYWTHIDSQIDNTISSYSYSFF